MNIPNLLTVIRFLLIPLCGYYLYNELYFIAGAIFVIACLTDLLDGYIARKYNMVTNFGKLADPAADKLLLITVLFILSVNSSVPLVIPVIVFTKELLMGIGGLVLLKNRYVVSSNVFGKIAAFIFNASVALIIIFKPNEIVTNTLLAVCVILMFAALVGYTIRYFNIKSNIKPIKQEK